MDVNEHQTETIQLYSQSLKHKLNWRNSVFIAVLATFHSHSMIFNNEHNSYWNNPMAAVEYVMVLNTNGTKTTNFKHFILI